MIAHSCSSERIPFAAAFTEMWSYTLPANDDSSDLHQIPIYLCADTLYSHVGTALAEPQCTMVAPDLASTTAEGGAQRGRDTEKLGTKKKSKMTEHKSTRKEVWISRSADGWIRRAGRREETREEGGSFDVDVWDVLMRSDGDTTPSRLHLFLAAHLLVSSSKPWSVMARVEGLGLKLRSQ